jgi:hypothetical protein
LELTTGKASSIWTFAPTESHGIIEFKVDTGVPTPYLNPVLATINPVKPITDYRQNEKGGREVPLFSEGVMYLYHGTSGTYIESIRQTGLKPRQERVGNWTTPGKVDSIAHAVYLTSWETHTDFYSLRASVVTGSKECANVVVRACVEIEPFFIPDENYFAPAVAMSDEMIEAQSLALKKAEEWKACLEKLALVAHLGGISPDRIEDTRTYPLEENPLYWMVKDSGTLFEMDCKLDALYIAASRKMIPAVAPHVFQVYPTRPVNWYAWDRTEIMKVDFRIVRT